MKKNKLIIVLVFLLAILVVKSQYVSAATTNTMPIPNINLTVDGKSSSPQEYVDNIKLLLVLTALSLLPSILLTMTSFTRISIVLSFLKNAIGTKQTPPSQVLIGLSLFLTFFVMSPTISKVNTNALQPYLNNQISQQQAIDIGTTEMKTFMLKQTRKKDLKLFRDIRGVAEETKPEDLKMEVVIPSFIISELKTAFTIGFFIYIPFLIIDFVVASVLMSMGMFMISPMMVSIPFKILLFIMVDGWNLIVKSLVLSFG